MNEQQLIDNALSDHKNFKVLVEKHYSVMLSVARSIIGDSLAEEVVQEAWLSAYRNLAKFEQRSTIKTWLISIVSNEAKNRLRKENRTISLGDLTADNEDPFLERYGGNGHWSNPPSTWHNDTPEALLNNRQFIQCLNQYMAKLSEQGRAALALKELHGVSLDQICNILDVTASNVRVLIHRSRHQILEHIEHFQETGTC